MYKAAVLGTSGAGKSTLAAALASLNEVPHVDLDDLAIGPSWQSVPDDQFRTRVLAVMDKPGWVIDGDYQRKLADLVLSRPDTAVWLDLPLHVSLGRMCHRVSRQIRAKVEVRHGSTLTWNLGLIRWVMHEVRSHARRRITMKSRLAKHQHLAVVHLRSQRQVDAWLDEQRSAAPQHPSNG
jgi:adenylate kinase family enzyme